MLTVIAALSLCFQSAPAPDDNRVRDAWPKLVEAWKALGDHKPGDNALDDDSLKVMSKVHDAFQAAGFFEPSTEYAPSALKQLFKLRGGRPSQTFATSWVVAGGLGEAVPAQRGARGSHDELLAAIRKLGDLK